MLEVGVQQDQASRLRQLASGRTTVPTPPGPRIITITSGKGGVGKSTLALNLALVLCGFEKQVLLADADANLGNLDVMLGLAPQFRLGDVLRGEKNVDDVLVSPFPGLHLLPGSSGDIDYPIAQASGVLMSALRSVGRPFDEIVIDTSAGLSPDIVGLAVEADDVVIVTTPEPTAVMDAYAMIKVVVRTRPDVPISVVMNAVRLTADADDAAAKLAVATDRFLGKSFAYVGAIPYDEHVVTSVARQSALVREFPACSASVSIRSVARRLLHQPEQKE